MILIVSDREDNSTSRVMEYLRYYSLPVIRINLEDDLQVIDGVISNDKVDFLFSLNGFQFKFSDISFYWYRRGAFRPRLKNQTPHLSFLNDLIIEDIEAYEYFFNDLFIKKCESLGDSRLNNLNKLTVLMDSVHLGIDVPETLLCTKKESFYEKRIISKGVFETTRFNYDDIFYGGDTIEVDRVLKDKLPQDLYLTSVQERLEKEFEIRSFFLKGDFYNMAILSQSNPRTKEDFRNYDREKPNRTVPCGIPSQLEAKLSKLYALHGLDTCSTDIVKTKDGRYALLDINPVGQFGMVSYPSNYFLEREIALLMKRTANGQVN